MSRKFSGPSLVLATHNAGKIKEINSLLGGRGISVISVASLGLQEPAETEGSFAGNARIKAHFAARSSTLPALADDSGIEVEALGGAPGVATADWAQTPDGRDYPMAMARVWRALEEINAPEPRRAAFVATMCLAWPDGHDEVFVGRVEGRLVWPARGDLGFGFDPMFLPEGESETFGEMAPERKAAMSHRTRAFRALVENCFD